MTSWMRNQLTKLYNAVSAPVTAMWDALPERLQSVRETASLLCNRMMENVGYGQEIKPRYLTFVLDQAVHRRPWGLRHVSDKLKEQGICEWVVYKNPWILKCVPDHFKTWEMCIDAVMEDPLLLRYVPDWLVTQQLIELWNDYCNDDRLIKWRNGYEKRKAQKANIKEELLPIAWHSGRVMDWCMSEDEKKEIEKLRK